MQETGKHYHDFNKRIACIRELAEETNLFMMVDRNGKLPEALTLEKLTIEYKDKFAECCRDFGVLPQIEKLLGFCRVATDPNLPVQ